MGPQGLKVRGEDPINAAQRLDGHCGRQISRRNENVEVS